MLLQVQTDCIEIHLRTSWGRSSPLSLHGLTLPLGSSRQLSSHYFELLIHLLVTNHLKK